MDNNAKLLEQIGAAEAKHAAAVPGPRAVRVVKASAPPARTEIGTTADPVDLCLEIWKNWMAGDADRDLGAKTMRGLVGEGDGHGYDIYEAQQASDIKVAMATDAMISSLSRLHVWAIYRSCSLATVWNFTNAVLVDSAAEARLELERKPKKEHLHRNVILMNRPELHSADMQFNRIQTGISLDRRPTGATLPHELGERLHTVVVMAPIFRSVEYFG